MRARPNYGTRKNSLQLLLAIAIMNRFTHRSVRPLANVIAKRTVVPKQTISTSLWKQSGAKIVVCDDGRQLDVEWESSTKPSNYHSIWLRRNCQCAECLNSTINQFVGKPHELDPYVAISEANITGQFLKPQYTHRAPCNSDVRA